MSMKVAYVHILPLELYPPATNALNILAQRPELEVRAYSSQNRNELRPFRNVRVLTTRRPISAAGRGSSSRLLRNLWWHMATAWSLRCWKPDAVVYVEPHSAIAAYLYYKLYRGSAKLFIHHHEYYAPEDYQGAGMRIPRLGHRLERAFLFQIAEWISQTNKDRLDLLRHDNPAIAEGVCRVLPNYPPRAWAPGTGETERPSSRGGPLRLIYVGSASFEDTYIREIVRWVGAHPDDACLHVCGYNVSPSVWRWIIEEHFGNVTVDPDGCEYSELPRLLAQHDVGLILYKANTTNFVYNAPNKLFEYVACGLDVWYPKEMAGIRHQHRETPGLAIREMDFNKLGGIHPKQLAREAVGHRRAFQFTAESALRPLIEELERSSEVSR